MSDSAETQKLKFKLFAFLPICSYRKRNGKVTFKLLGLPVFKIKEKRTDSAVTIKYYICGIPILKIKQKYVANNYG